MYGYCKLREHCPKQHVDVVCPTYRECNDNGCVLRHPNTCKYFARYKKCKFVTCAYSHEKEEHDVKIEVIEKDNMVLKHEIEELKIANKKKLENVHVETRANTIQLTKLISTVDDIVERLNVIEQEQAEYIEKDANEEEATAESHENTEKDPNVNKVWKGTESKEANIPEHEADNIETDETSSTADETDQKHKKIASNTKESINNKCIELKFKCQECRYECQNNVTLQKHWNTKHACMATVTKGDTIDQVCGLCEDKFSTTEDFNEHIAEHIEEIENISIESLTNGHDLFECNMCSFESGHEDSVKEHLIEHVNPPKTHETTNESGYEGSIKEQLSEHSNTSQTVDTFKDVTGLEKPSHRLIDEYDDDGNYIGNDPRFM